MDPRRHSPPARHWTGNVGTPPGCDGSRPAGCLCQWLRAPRPAIELPDLDDRHVVAAAIRAKAQVIVTFNEKNFPPAVLEEFDLATQHPDTFLHHLTVSVQRRHGDAHGPAQLSGRSGQVMEVAITNPLNPIAESIHHARKNRADQSLRSCCVPVRQSATP
jgi:hypothetical protein